MTKLERKEYKDGKNYSGSWILEYDEYKYPNDLEKVTKLILYNLHPKYLNRKYLRPNIGNPLFGHCYHTTQSLYYFFITTPLTIMSAKCEHAGNHWWLVDGDENIIDITADQYYSIGRTPPYDNGKVTKRWYGWKGQVHKKSMNLMKTIQPNANLYHIG